MFAPDGRHDNIKLIIELVAQFGWKIYHMDAKLAFLYGVLEEEIYVEQPTSIEVIGHEDKVYNMNKALYRLNQASRAWYCRMDAYLLLHGFEQSENVAFLYVKNSNDEKQLIFSFYVDDSLVTGNDYLSLNAFKAEMMKEFEMTDLGERV